MALVLNTPRVILRKYADKDGFVIGHGELGPSELVYYYGDREEIEIPEGVEYIGTDVIRWSPNVKKVRFPKTLKKIERDAFYFSEIECVELPEGLTEIEHWAFASCHRLRTVHLPESLKCLGSFAFYGCENLMDLKIPHHVSMEAGVFSGCKGLADENGLVIAENRVFDYFGSGETVQVPEGVRVIDYSAFKGGRFESISLPKSLSSIGYGAFSKCPNLKRVRIPEYIEEISPYAFESSVRVEAPERILQQLGSDCPENWVGY